MRAELLLILAWAEVTIDGSGGREGTLAERRRTGLDLEELPVTRATTSHGRKPRADRRGAHAGGGERRWSPRARRRGRRPAQTSPTAGGRTRRMWQDRARRPSARSRWPTAARSAPRRFPGAALQHHEPARRRARPPRRCGSTARRATAERARRTAGSARSPRSLADHDTGLLAAMAGDHSRAQELLARALTSPSADRARPMRGCAAPVAHAL